MFKKLFWLLLIIILVCLNWFSKAAAQDLSSLSDADQAALMEMYQQRNKAIGVVTDADNYQSPTVYEAAPEVGLPFFADDQIPEKSSSERHPARITPFEDLKPFGTELFSGPREVNPPNDIASAEDYILGPGDNLIVALWGQVEKEYALTVDREGKIFVPRLGELIAWGKSLGDFEQQLKRKFSGVYSQFNMTISLGKIRSIRIYLTGEVKRPGAYTVSSLTSMFNALYLAGGPTETGSMRDIRLMRNGQKVAGVDLYKFLLEGDNSSDSRLESGDAIFVPVAGPMVAVRGKIRREAIYELVGGQSALDLLTLAGRATADAYLDRVMLDRVGGRGEWEVLDLNLNTAKPDSVVDIALLDGDRLTVFSVFEMKTNMVSVFGQVKHPGFYERSDSARVSYLIDRSELQPYDVYTRRANLFRRLADWRTEIIAIDLERIINGYTDQDILLEDGDSLHIYSVRDVAWQKYIYIEGEVKKPGRYPLHDKMTVSDLVFLAGSYKRGASMLRAEVARFDSLGEVSLQFVGLRENDAEHVVLHEDDRVYVRRIPQWQMHRTVRIEGEVAYPGEYVLSSREETLYDLIIRAGGISEQAFPEGTIFERRSISETLSRQNIPKLLERSSPVREDSLGRISRQVLFEYEQESMNRIVLDVNEVLARRGSSGDVMLEPGDKIFIPTRPSGISVLGAVGSNGTIAFRQGEKVKYYLKRAGSFTRDADKGGLRLIRANGEVYSGNGAQSKHVQMGDIVVVPTKIHRDRNWTKTLGTVLTTATGVLTSIFLIDRL
jgi:protein involved in polysaccharide export with SLBB domain